MVVQLFNLDNLREIAQWTLRYNYLIGSNARIDMYAEYLLLVAYGMVMCFLYLSYCIYWRRKGLLT